MINKIKRLYEESGLFLLIIRLPFKVVKICLDYFTTFYYTSLFDESGSNVYIEYGAKIAAPKRIKVGNNVHIGKGVEILSETPEGILKIGSNVEIGRMCRLDITGNLTLNDDVHLSRGCQISTHTHNHCPKSKPISRALIIKEKVWLGAEVFVMDSCEEIEKNCLLATRAVVTKSILEEGVIYAGIPAKKIGNRSD